MAIANIEPAKTIVGVVAGNMGSGIAQKYATEGFKAVVVDINEDAVAAGKQRVTDTLNEGVARKVFTEEKRDWILDNMTFTSDKGALKEAALVVEAIFENKEIKQTLFRELVNLQRGHHLGHQHLQFLRGRRGRKNNPPRKRDWASLLFSPCQKPFGRGHQG